MDNPRYMVQGSLELKETTMWNLLLPLVGSVIDKIFPDPVKAAEAKLELYKLQQSGELAVGGGLRS